MTTSRTRADSIRTPAIEITSLVGKVNRPLGGLRANQRESNASVAAMAPQKRRGGADEYTWSPNALEKVMIRTTSQAATGSPGAEMSWLDCKEASLFKYRSTSFCMGLSMERLGITQSVKSPGGHFFIGLLIVELARPLLKLEIVRICS